MGNQTKKCSRCKKVKSLVEFHKNRSKRNGRHNLCKICRRVTKREYVKRHPDKIRQQGWKQKGIHITIGEYNKRFAKQEGCCAVCGIHQLEVGKHLSVDHNHKTGGIRGLLCNSCNLMIGYAGEDSTKLKKAILYLKKEEQTSAL